MPEEPEKPTLTRADYVQMIGALVAAGGFGMFSPALGVTVLGVLCIVFGVAMERS